MSTDATPTPENDPTPAPQPPPLVYGLPSVPGIRPPFTPPPASPEEVERMKAEFAARMTESGKNWPKRRKRKGK